MENLKLTDDAISHIAKLIQVAILTGTDIVDNLRTVSFVSSEDGLLMITPECAETFQASIENLLESAPKANSGIYLNEESVSTTAYGRHQGANKQAGEPTSNIIQLNKSDFRIKDV